MRWQKTIQLLDVHCEGEVGKVITGGVLTVPGKTMQDKLDYFNNVNDSLRRFVIQEPRGSLQMSVNLLLPPTQEEAHAGMVIFQADKTHPMSGSNSICVVTALLETGMVEMQEPTTEVVLDTAAGLVRAQAECEGGRCRRVRLNMTPAFVEQLDYVLPTEKYGDIKLDIAFGGVFYGLVDVEQIGLSISPEYARELAEIGTELCRLLNSRIQVQHPLYPQINGVAYVMFRNHLSPDLIQTCTTLPPGRVDRSPCGTGSTANLATLAARGLVQVGDTLTSQSIIGGRFQAAFLGETEVAGKPAVLVAISGRAWVYGIHQLGIDPDDPLSEGFMLSDTWGKF